MVVLSVETTVNAQNLSKEVILLHEAQESDYSRRRSISSWNLFALAAVDPPVNSQPFQRLDIAAVIW